jgi:hypothetical protein
MRHRRVVATLICCFFCAGGAIGARDEVPILVGVLEDIEPGNLSPGMASPHVRLAFTYKDSAWGEMSYEYPALVKWTVVFDGRQIGTIQSRASLHPAYLGGDVGIEAITTDQASVPRVSLGASSFDYSGNRARTRPLLLVSTPHFEDPDHWKPTTLSAGERRIAIEHFRGKIPSLEQCDQPEEQPIHLVPYSDDEIVFIKAYRSKTGRVLLGQRLDDRRSNCGFFDDPVFFDYWFVLKGTAVQFLDTQMAPMDAADLARTGSSVWVFQTSRGEDRDGYELFYDDFSKKVSFSWTYH